mgnify:CR=1 FL=1
MLCRDTFKLGYTKFTDETKVQMLFGVKSFVSTWLLLCYTSVPQHVGLPIDQAHEDLNTRLNEVFELFNYRRNVPVEFTYALFAVIAAVISFSIVKVNINFGYYFFVMTRAFANSEGLVH